MRCRLRTENVAVAAVKLAESIAQRRLRGSPRLYSLWQSRLLGLSEYPVEDRQVRLFKARLLQNIGTPDHPDPLEHLHGLVAESIWVEVVWKVDVGLGNPLHVEDNDYSSIDPGGDGLSVYRRGDGGFCFRLWESKHHGTIRNPVRRTVNAACRQVSSSSVDYLSRFSLIAQRTTDDDVLSRFYGILPELWVDRDPAAGVGISVATNIAADVTRCFGRVITYFNLDPNQHQAQLHLLDDFAELARRVREHIWKGCGLWTEP